MTRSGWSVAILSAAAVTCAVAVGAQADGLPVVGVDVGASGVTAPGGGPRYVTVAAGTKTVVAAVDPRGGRILDSRLLGGTFTIPAVAYDGSASGLSADGRTLVLIQPRGSFPRAETGFVLLSTRQLRPIARVRLRGDFSFDAISPRGRLMYLIEYNVPTDPTRYLVRAFDLQSRRLLAEPVVDPREHTEKMRGSPVTRATSTDGRVAYTLYDGAGGTPFVHALDTSRRTARCIDLAMLTGAGYLWQLRLFVSRDGRTLTVRDGDDIEAVVDTQTFRVTMPRSLAAAHPAHRLSYVAAVSGAAVAMLVLLGAIGWRRQRPARAGEAAT